MSTPVRPLLVMAALLGGCVGHASGGGADAAVDAGADVEGGGTDAGSVPVDAGVSYALPGPGGVVTLGTNTAADLASVFPGYTADVLATALFDSFGSGTYVRDYSPRGAYVLTAMGGHASPPQLTGAVLFDFHDATWKAFENANGVPSTAEVARWAYFPPDDRFYFRPLTDGGATLHRLTASGRCAPRHLGGGHRGPRRADARL